MRTLTIVLVSVMTFLSFAPAQTPIYEIRGSTGLEQLGRDVAGVADVNADGLSDFVTVSAGAYRVRSGYDGATLVSGLIPLSWVPSASNFSAGRSLVTGAGDVNGDGHGDLLVRSSPGSFEIHSGMTGALLTTLAYELVVPAGDVNGDGTPDFLARSWAPSAPFTVGVVSGGSGAVLQIIASNGGTSGYGADIAAPGDLNGDGVGDYLIGVPDFAVPVQVQVAPGIWLWSHCTGGVSPTVLALSGAAPATVLYFVQGAPNTDFGDGLVLLGDVTGDGIQDFAAYGSGSECPLVGFTYYFPGSTGGSVSIHSGASGAQLSLVPFPGPPYQDFSIPRIAGIGDVNGDGYGDLVTGYPWLDVAAVIYGNNLTTIQSQLHAPDSQFWGLRVAGAGDVNGDGVGDILVADYQANLATLDQGLVRVYSGTALAASTVADLGGGCSATLNLTGASLSIDPVIPSMHTWSISGVSPSSPGVMAWSPGAPPPIPLSPGCTLHVDPAVALLQAANSDPSGSWTQALALPALPWLAGLEITAQAVFIPPGAGLGLELTNALRVTLGYEP